MSVVSRKKFVFFVAGSASALDLLRSVVQDYEGMWYSQVMGKQDLYLVFPESMQGFRYIVQFCACVVVKWAS